MSYYSLVVGKTLSQIKAYQILSNQVHQMTHKLNNTCFNKEITLIPLVTFNVLPISDPPNDLRIDTVDWSIVKHTKKNKEQHRAMCVYKPGGPGRYLGQRWVQQFEKGKATCTWWCRRELLTKDVPIVLPHSV